MTFTARLASVTTSNKKYIQKGTVKMYNEKKKTTTIQIKVSQEIKDKITQRAKAAELTVSDFMRTAALSNDKMIFLNESGSIAKSLTEININLDRALRGMEITTNIEKELLEKLGDIYDIFYDILDSLSNINQLDNLEED